MAKSCPILGSKDWKLMMNQLGENLAWRVYETYDGYPTTLKSTTDLKTEIGIPNKTFPSNLPNLYNKIKIYNNKNNTSHSIKTNSIGQSEQLTVQFVPNYLPVNHIKRLEKENIRKDDGRLQQTIQGINQLELFGDNLMFNVNDNKINYTLKSVNILQSDEAKQVFNKGRKNLWSLDKILTELSIPKQQIELIKEIEKEFTQKQFAIYDEPLQYALELASKYSYTIEINTAKTNSQYSERSTYNPEDGYQPEEIYDEPTERNTQHYSNLTVPGGTNYTENEISTPLIIPSIEGHPQFSTPQGIGWFRSDEKANSNSKRELTSDELFNLQQEGLEDRTLDFNKVKNLGKFTEGSKTRRILEIQSDLFQKGRDKENLVHNNLKTNRGIDFETELGIHYKSAILDNQFETAFKEKDEYNNPIEYTKFENNKRIEISKKEFDLAEQKYVDNINSKLNQNNQFLQLLNKDNNWVTFFIKSIIQDSIKKGYEKVLFPTGKVVAKIQKYSEAALKYAELLEKKSKQVISTQEELAIKEYSEFNQKAVINIYEIDIKNILDDYLGGNKNNRKKGIYKLQQITDEYDNTWNEIILDNKTNNHIFLSLKNNNKIIENFDDKIKSILDKAGISVNVVKSLYEKYGINAIGIANLTKGLIELVEGAGSKILSEETAHFIIEHLYNSNDVNLLKILESPALKKTDTYKLVLEQYKDLYTTDLQFTKETLGKLLADALLNNFEANIETKSFIGRLKEIWNKIIKIFSKKTLQSDINNFLNQTSKDFLNEDLTIDNYQGTDLMFNLNAKEEELLDDAEESLKKRLNYLRKYSRIQKEITRVLPNYLDSLKNFRTEEDMVKAIKLFFKAVSLDIKGEYNPKGKLKRFLDKYTQGLIDPKDIPADKVQELRNFLVNYENSLPKFANYIYNATNEEIKDLRPEFDALIGDLNIIKGIIGDLERTAFLNFVRDVPGINITEEIFKKLHIEKDVSILRPWLLSPTNSSSDLVRAVTFKVLEAKQQTADYTNEVLKTMLTLDKKLRDKGFDFDNFYEKDENGQDTGYYISPINRGKYMAAVKELEKEIEIINAYEGTIEEAYEHFQYILKDSKIKTLTAFKNRTKRYKEGNFKKMIISIAYSNFAKANSNTITDENGQEYQYPKTKLYGQPNYKKLMEDSDVKEYYETLMYYRTKEISHFPKSIKNKRIVGFTDPDMLLYTPPQVRKDLLQSITTGSGLRTQIKEIFALEDVQEMYNQEEVYLDLRGRQHKSVPLYYINPIDKKDLSKSITANTVIFSNMASNYHNMLQIASNYEIMQDALKSLQFRKGKNVKPFIESNVGETLSNLIDINVYNKKADASYITLWNDKKINVTQAIDNVNAWMRHSNLIMKHATVVSGHIKATIDTKIENFVGQITTHESSLFSEAEFMKNVAQVMSQWGSNNQTNVMQRYFEDIQLFKQFKDQYKHLENNKLSKLFLTSEFWYSLYEMGSYRSLGKVALSIGDNYRFYNNRFINYQEWKDLGKTKDEWKQLKEKGLTFYQLMQDHSSINKDVFNKAKNRVIYTIKNKTNEIEGRLTDIDRGKASRMALARLALTHRSWLIRGIDLRLKGYQYDPQTELETEGYYRTVANYLARTFIKKDAEYSFRKVGFEKLSPLEKRAVIRLGVDLAFLGLLITLHHLLAAMADDDDDYIVDYLAYISARVYMEHVSLVSPTELYETMKNPFPTLNRIGYIGDIVKGLINHDEIQRGQYKGFTKQEKAIVQLVPGLSVFWEYSDPDLKRHRLEQSYIIGY